MNMNAGQLESGYWSRVLGDFVAGGGEPVWRQYCDQMYGEIVGKWLRVATGENVLKTDLFDEAVGDGLAVQMSACSANLHGIDVSPDVVKAATDRHPEIRGDVADVRALPFEDRMFDAIISNSTLDHFPSRFDIAKSLKEFGRVLRPGGRLFVSLDNLANPVIAVRQILPFRLLNSLGVLPYFTGATLGPVGLRKYLIDAGFSVESMKAIMHVPRLPAIRYCRSRRGKLDDAASHRVIAHMKGYERMGRWPTRYITGYYVAALAVRL